MLTLAVDTSAKSVSAALVEDGMLLAQYSQCCGLTHSRTLMPMVEALLCNTGRKREELSRLAVSAGPGSFTGVRIGIAAVKGLAWALEKPAVGVSTLEAMAWHALGQPEGTVICCAMDARRGQLYNALFALRGGQPERLTPDRAISLEELAQEEKMRAGRTFVVGDGARLCYNGLRERGLAPVLAPPPLEHQSAWGVAMAAGDRPGTDAKELLPVYLRLSQAERERQARLQKKGERL